MHGAPFSYDPACARAHVHESIHRGQKSSLDPTAASFWWIQRARARACLLHANHSTQAQAQWLWLGKASNDLNSELLFEKDSEFKQENECTFPATRHPNDVSGCLLRTFPGVGVALVEEWERRQRHHLPWRANHHHHFG